MKGQFDQDNVSTKHTYWLEQLNTMVIHKDFFKGGYLV